MRAKLLCAALVLAPAGLASAGGLCFLERFLGTTVNRLMITILPPSKSDPSNIAVVEGDMRSNAMMDQPAAAMIRAREAHRTATGRAVLVAVLDAGFDLSHPVLEGHVSPGGYDTLDGDDDPNDIGNGYDDYGEGTPDNAVGHGNFVAGMVLLAAPDATILPIRVMDDEGYGNNQALAAGIRLALERGARVINVSGRAAWLGAWDVSSALDDAEALGAVVVASAGNEGRAGLGVVAGDPRSVSVGAVDCDSTVAPFSNRAGWREQLTVYAPGVDLHGPMTGGAMGTWSGTSFSAGLASGAAALWLELEPLSSPGAVHERIRRCVNPAFDPEGNRCPAGVVDLLQIVTR
jgi:hypothetical protein